MIKLPVRQQKYEIYDGNTLSALICRCSRLIYAKQIASALNTQEQAAKRIEELEGLLRKVRDLIQDPDIKVQGRNFIDLTADKLFREIDAALVEEKP